MELSEKLAEGLQLMRLDVSASRQQQLMQYVALLDKWNRVYNLTAIRDIEQMVTLHLLDSISVLPFIRVNRLLDVGSGGGLPGVVLAICLPELQVTTIDKVQKKAIFMRQVKGELGLDNLTVLHDRVEQHQPEQPYEAVISRAFSEVDLLMRLTRHLLKDGGRWLAMKGLPPKEELAGLPTEQYQVHPLSVAGLDAQRHLVVIEKY